MTTEEYLRNLIDRIERSHISRDEKDEIYGTMSQGLHAAVLPVLVHSMPQDKLTTLSRAPEHVTVEEYYTLIQTALDGGKALQQMDILMQNILQSIEATLKSKFIIE